MSLPIIFSFLFSKHIRIESRIFVYLYWFSLFIYTAARSTFSWLTVLWWSIHFPVCPKYRRSSTHIECWYIYFQCLLGGMSSTPPKDFPHRQIISTFHLVRNNHIITFLRSLLKNIGPRSFVTPELARALRFDQGPMFFNNERKKGYYMIYSQPTNHSANLNSTFL